MTFIINVLVNKYPSLVQILDRDRYYIHVLPLFQNVGDIWLSVSLHSKFYVCI
jgi:hypothetical protein